MKKLFAIVAMMGLFATTQVYALDENEGAPAAGDVQNVQDETAEQDGPVGKNALVDKLNEAEANKEVLDKQLADLKKTFDKWNSDYTGFQKDSLKASEKAAKLEGEYNELASEAASLTEVAYRLKIDRIVNDVIALLDSEKLKDRTFKTESNKINNAIKSNETSLNKVKKNLDAKKKALDEEKAKLAGLEPKIQEATFKKDSLGFEVKGLELKSQVAALEIEGINLNIAFGENLSDDDAINDKLAQNETAVQDILAEAENVKNELAAIVLAKYPPVEEEVEKPVVEPTETVEVTEGGIKAVHKSLKTKFIEGGPEFMALVSIALVIGLAFCIERIIYLSFAKVDAKVLMGAIADALSRGDIEGAKNICRNTAGPVASICYQGLLRVDEGLDVVERSVVSYGSLQSSMLEKGCSWITLFIAMAPSLGFLGTVIGMVMSFDTIQREGDISPTIVAGGMKVALITTIYGIIVALVLQVFYNFILTKIESIVADMEDSSITLLDLLTKYNLKK